MEACHCFSLPSAHGLVGFLTMKKTALPLTLLRKPQYLTDVRLAYGTTYFSAVIFIGYAGKIGWQFGISSCGLSWAIP